MEIRPRSESQWKTRWKMLGHPDLSSDQEPLTVHEYTFEHICEIDPLKNGDGTVFTYQPDLDSEKPQHEWAIGPFCLFKIPRGVTDEGVYIITADREVRYVGETENLHGRFNQGHGRISAANCYKTGRSTNCHVNQRIRGSVESGHELDLWFLQTPHRNAIEDELKHLGPWNRG